MRGYINIDGTVTETVFEVSSNCCTGNEALSAVEAHIYSKSGSCLLLRYPAHKLCAGEVTFRWDEQFYSLRAGWYILEIQTHGCRSCGEHTVRIGKDCFTNWKHNVASETAIECGEETPVKPTNYG